MVIENRRSYRLPFINKVIIGTDSKVYSGSAVNISFGGVFVSVDELKDVVTGAECTCVLQLSEEIPILKLGAIVKRINKNNSNPDDVPGLGIQFYKNSFEILKPLKDFLLDLKKDYEALSTVLFTTEPELRSLLPIVQRLHLKGVDNLAELKLLVDRTIHSIEHVESKYGKI